MEDTHKSWSEWAIYILTEIERFSKSIERLNLDVIENSKETILLRSEVQKVGNSIINNKTEIINKITELDEKNKNMQAEINDLKKFKIRAIAIISTNIILVIIGFSTAISNNNI
jgi:hypothetical protein